MSPDNIGSAVNRFSGWPSNDSLKTDKESMTSPVTVQVIKMIAAILDPHRIVVGIDTLYTTQRETFTSESQQLIESALQTLHVMNLNNLETNLDEEGHGNDSNLLIVFYVQIMPDDFVMQLHRF